METIGDLGFLIGQIRKTIGKIPFRNKSLDKQLQLKVEEIYHTISEEYKISLEDAKKLPTNTKLRKMTRAAADSLVAWYHSILVKHQEKPSRTNSKRGA